MPSGKIVARESYGADGTVEFVNYEKKDAGGTPTLQKKDAGGTPAPQRKIQLAPCGAPELKPDATLVVLPLPLRSRHQVLQTRKLLSDANYDRWSEDDALAMIAADLGEFPAEIKQIIGQRFFRRNDRRMGFYALLFSTGRMWNPKEKHEFQGGDPLLLDPLADHPDKPLAKYIAAYSPCCSPVDPRISATWQTRLAAIPTSFGSLPGSTTCGTAGTTGGPRRATSRNGGRNRSKPWRSSMRRSRRNSPGVC
jgi:hypothetical protein